MKYPQGHKVKSKVTGVVSVFSRFFVTWSDFSLLKIESDTRAVYYPAPAADPISLDMSLFVFTLDFLKFVNCLLTLVVGPYFCESQI